MPAAIAQLLRDYFDQQGIDFAVHNGKVARWPPCFTRRFERFDPLDDFIEVRNSDYIDRLLDEIRLLADGVN
jgi:hypothetical protein